jgi:hypothetical protein
MDDLLACQALPGFHNFISSAILKLNIEAIKAGNACLQKNWSHHLET